MNWLSSPKVRLALIVNGLYFISLVIAPSPRHERPHFFDQARASLTERPALRRMPVFATLPPPSVPPKATTHIVKEWNQLNVYLTNDLTLVKRPGHRLLFSPTFTTSATNPEAPETILLRFISYSKQQMFSEASLLSIKADGDYKVKEGEDGQYLARAARYSVAVGEDDEAVETIAIELPYELFVETITARKVIIQLGPDSVALTAAQIEALRDMHYRLPQPPSPDGSH